MNADIRLTLGPIAFSSFEVPERIGYGGGQKLAVHQLPGGTRVVDAMGRDDAQVVWSGAFSGPDAADRMRVLDALRVAGIALPLTWDAFFYTVVISDFHVEYTTPWWITYRVVCTVVQDEAAELIAVATSLATSVVSDLTQAGNYVDVSGAQSALSTAGATTRGTTQYAQANSAVQTIGDGVDAQLDSAGMGLSSPDLATVVSSAGTLAQLAVARAYIGRAAVNLANAST